MKALHVVQFSLPYSHVGYAVRTNSIVNGLREAGVNVAVATAPGFPHRSTRTVLEECHNGIVYYRTGCTPSHWLRRALIYARRHRWRVRADLEVKCFARALAAIIDHAQPDLIHVHSPGRLMAAAARARDSMRIPLIYEARGLWFETSLAEGKLSPYSDKHMMLIEEELTAIECADHVVAIAGALRDEFIRWGARSDTISVVPNGVDLADFPPLPPDTTLADHLGLTGSCVVGYITSVRSIEGLDILIRAVRSARAAGTSIKALIVGDGEDLPRLKRLAVELKIADAVVFTGRIPHQDVARYYSIIDLFVVPRIDAPVNRLVTPLKPYEAMAMERTVLVSRLPALMEMIKEGETGYAFPAGDFSALATLLTRLCADAHARDVVGMSARRFVANERAWKNITQQYLALYRNALDKSRSSHL